MTQRIVGIDVGAETVKAVEITAGPRNEVVRRALCEHHKRPQETLLDLLKTWDWPGVTRAAVSGRLARSVRLPRVPTRVAQARALRRLYGEEPATVVSIGSHGFSVLELRASGAEVFRENSRCSQGTGNFLRQLVERFELDLERAGALCEDVGEPAPLSGRCPVILKTDMTHLVNGGEQRARVLAGLYDAVCANVQVLIKPRSCPPAVLLCGGVTRSRRIREHFRAYLDEQGMALIESDPEEMMFLEALGTALEAADADRPPPAVGALFRQDDAVNFDRVPPVAASLARVKRLPPRPPVVGPPDGDLVLGLDIGSTGSKCVALDARTRDVAWEGYRSTLGDPVGAAQALVREFAEAPAGSRPVTAFGATGSGREIVGSLLATSYGVGAVRVLNEIAAHARGAVEHDPRVDTIFEIGGQDAKYIRLEEGRVVDAAMNEACSAGTGSFIEEQGSKFHGIQDVEQLGQEAVAAPEGVSLGQHCSVFMAEVIDEAVGAGEDQGAIIAGIYDSIISNYLNRVKGSRGVGDVVFCQGMPFAADALAAAVARQTGCEVIVPPNPGTVGALGIALLALETLPERASLPLDLGLFLSAREERKETFVCQSTKGCGGHGNHCRVDRLRTVVDGKRRAFTWGGGCSLWDSGTGGAKLPDRSPDPFRLREALVAQILDALQPEPGRPTISLTDEFTLKGTLPFFATYLHELGFHVVAERGAGRALLRRGIEGANVPFCAPMQIFHGVVDHLAERETDHLFLPMLRSLPRVNGEELSALCPVVQAAPDLLRRDLGAEAAARIVSPVIDFGVEGFDSRAFEASCRLLARDLGRHRWRTAFEHAYAVQRHFDEACRRIGTDALAYAREHDLVAVVVLGRPYTIYNDVLNSNVPALLREHGAFALPGDCYPVSAETPAFESVFWGYGQRNLRAASQIRNAAGVYAVWCSNYSCGPDSFNLQFFAYLMEGKPYTVIETDGHSGDAGTKTRIEAFLHCVRQDLDSAAERKPSSRALDGGTSGLALARREGRTVLIPPLGRSAAILGACMRGQGVDAEVVPDADREAIRLGRRHTSGKECFPMCVTLGSLLRRLELEPDERRRFCFFMARANGPCRLGAYHILDRIVLERLGMTDRVSIWAAGSENYFDGAVPGLTTLFLAGVSAADMLEAALLDVRPVESIPGAADALYERYMAELVTHVERQSAALGRKALMLQNALAEPFGCGEILRRAASEFRAVKLERDLPTVLVVGEIYMRLDAAANDGVVRQLEERGLHVRLAPVSEWLEYIDQLNLRNKRQRGLAPRIASIVQSRVRRRAYAIMAKALDWPPRTSVRATLGAGREFLREDLWGEAILTVGGSVEEHRRELVDGVVNVGPFECMPSKIAESQLLHAAEDESLLSLSLQFNGEPIDPEALDTFAYAVRTRHRTTRASPPAGPAPNGTPRPRAPRRRAQLRGGETARPPWLGAGPPTPWRNPLPRR